MTNEKILQLAKSCGIENWTRDKGECWECLEEHLLKFAREMYDKGRDDEAELYVDENY